MNGSSQVSLREREKPSEEVKRLPEYSVGWLRCRGTLGIVTEEMVVVPLRAAKVTFVFHWAEDDGVKTVTTCPERPILEEGQLTVMAWLVAAAAGEPSV